MLEPMFESYVLNFAVLEVEQPIGGGYRQPRTKASEEAAADDLGAAHKAFPEPQNFVA